MEEGDILRVDYEIWIEDSGELYETTIEELAKENGIYDPNKHYHPMVLIVGESDLLEDLDKAIREGKEGDEIEVILPPEKAYGHRDPKLVKVHSYRELARLEIEPEIGKEVYIKGKMGKIISVTPGRVLVDYNHPLAGKTLKYKLHIKEIVKDAGEKVKAIMEIYYHDVENFEVEVGDEEITIKVEGRAKFDPNWAMAKPKIIRDIRKYLGNMTIKFVEVYPRREEKAEEEMEEKEENKQEVKEEEREESESVPENSPDTVEGSEE